VTHCFVLRHSAAPEISGAIKQATGLEHTKRTEADIAAW
jgi:hypothetical protein